jgi:hypothetical protein
LFAAHVWAAFLLYQTVDNRRLHSLIFLPDFSNWKNHDSYQEAFQRLISDLKASDSKPK